MIQIAMWIHRLRGHKQHSHRVTIPMFDISARGILTRCSCGEDWAQ